MPFRVGLRELPTHAKRFVERGDGIARVVTVGAARIFGVLPAHRLLTQSDSLPVDFEAGERQVGQIGKVKVHHRRVGTPQVHGLRS